MKILVIYGTTEGQTRKIARFAVDRLVGAGRSVEMLSAADAAEVDTRLFDGVIVAGSVHAGRYQKDLVRFAQGRAGELAQVPTLFLSVSLAAAGADEDDWKGIRACVDRFVDETGWAPARVEHVAGAFRFGEYDFFKSWAMRWIAHEKGEAVPAHGEDKEYTDWAALATLIEEWAAALAP